jgi:hypothetical protein
VVLSGIIEAIGSKLKVLVVGKMVRVTPNFALKVDGGEIKENGVLGHCAGGEELGVRGHVERITGQRGEGLLLISRRVDPSREREGRSAAEFKKGRRRDNTAFSRACEEQVRPAPSGGRFISKGWS